MKHRKDFNQLYSLVRESKALDGPTRAMIADYDKYFKAFPSHDKVDYETFLPRFMAWHPTLNDEQKRNWNAMINNVILTEVDADQKNNIVRWVADVELTTNIANVIEQFNAGEVEDVFAALSSASDGWRTRTGFKLDSFIDIPIGDLLQDEFDDTGVKFRLGCLNASMRPLRPGDFGIVAARPDRGKTSFLASEGTYWAPQLPPDRNILWLNNEGTGKRIIPSLYRAALNLNMTEMKIAHAAGKLEDGYIKKVGRRDRIRIVDCHGWSNGQVEMAIEDHNAGIVIFDMIDNIRGFGDAARTDLALEYMYQWARERMVKFDAVGVATSQISNDGDGLMFPSLGMLKDSKTGKQGACDFQLMIGASNDAGLASARYLGLPKNKLRRPDGKADPQCEVIFDALRARFTDVSVGPPTVAASEPRTPATDAEALQEALT